jgi:hypothetical protein
MGDGRMLVWYGQRCGPDGRSIQWTGVYAATTADNRPVQGCHVSSSASNYAPGTTLGVQVFGSCGVAPTQASRWVSGAGGGVGLYRAAGAAAEPGGCRGAREHSSTAQAWRTLVQEGRQPLR